MNTASERLLGLTPEARKALLVRLLQQKAGTEPMTAPVSHGQRALWFMQQLEPASAAYNEPFAWRIRADVDAEALRRAFQGLVDRHPILRTTYASQDGQPVQQIHGRLPVPFVESDASVWNAAEFDACLAEEALRPFDLEHEPPLRVALYRRSEAEQVLLLVMHHIAMDLWSLGVLLEDLRCLYTAEKTGRPARLAPLDTRYTDFVRGQAETLAGPEGERWAAYWERQLAAPLPALNLPTDRPRPAARTHRGAAFSFAIPDDLARRLRNLARTESVTLYVTMLAGFEVLLHRYSGQDDILVGTPTAGRFHPEWRKIVGYLVNPVVLRANFAGNPTFREFLTQANRTVVGALAHQEYPFPLLVERLQPTRDPSRTPLFQANFAWEKPLGGISASTGTDATPGTRFELGELVLESVELPQQAAKFDLTLMVLEAGPALSVTLQYNADLWDAATIARMAGHYQTLLEAIVANPGQSIGELPLLTTAERRQLLIDFNDTTRPYPQSCIQQLIEAQVEKTPEAVAVIQGNQTLTYRELNRRANQLAHHLRSLGVGPEVRVGLCTERSMDTVVGILGILKAGGAYVPLDLAYPKDRLAFMLADSQVGVLLTPAQFAFDLPEHQARVVCLDADQDLFSRESAENPVANTTSDNLAYVIYTSGSTGRPKGVLVTHRGIGNLAQAQNRVFAIGPDSRVLQFASLSFDASVSEIVTSLVAGAALILGTRESLLPGPGLLRLLRDQAVTTVTLPPSALATLSPDDLPNLRTVVAAGEACPAEVVTRWAPGRKFINGYGPTENTVCATMAECRPDGRRPSIGRPMDNVQVYILDGRRQLVPVGVPGELHIGGVGLARGYHNRPELTAEKFIAHPFRTEPGARLYKSGDLARWLPDGTIEFLGRLDHQVKIRGFRIELGEVEAALAQHPAISETVVVARTDDRGDKRLAAYFVARDGEATPVDELRSFLKERLPDYMVPAVFVRLDAFPLTPNGKVDRQALPAPDTSRPDLRQAFVAPQGPVQKLLAAVWAEVLGLEQVGIHDNFFDLGGASIQTLQVAERATALGLALTPELLFQYQSIAELEAVVSGQWPVASEAAA